MVIGRKKDSFCASFESFAYLNLVTQKKRELGPGEIIVMTPEGIETLSAPGKEMKICTFLWIYYGYPSSSYEGISVEEMRCRCGAMLARRDDAHPDTVAGVPDSGTAHAIGYANESGIPFSRPFIKYTPTWPRSFIPTIQKKRDLIAKMKLIPVHELIQNRSLLLIDDSIVRGTQLRGNDRISLPERSQRGACAAGLPASGVRLQIPELLPFHLRHGSDHPQGHQRNERYGRAGESFPLFRPGKRGV